MLMFKRHNTISFFSPAVTRKSLFLYQTCCSWLGVGGQRHAQAAFTSGKETRDPLYRRLGGPWGRNGMVGKISPSPGFKFQTV